MIYETAIESADPEKLRSIQASALREYLTSVSSIIPEYRELIVGAGLDKPHQVRDDAELLRRFSSIGFTDAAAYVSIDSSALKAVDKKLYYLESTSGTTSVPKSRYVTRSDDLLDQHLMARSFAAFDVKPEDRVLTVDLGELNFYALATKGIARLGIFDSVFYCARKPFADSMREALSCEPSVLLTTPSILLRSLPALSAKLSATKSLKKLVYYCEALDPQVQHYLHREFGIESFSLYSSVELGMIGAECTSHRGVHLWADVLLPAIKDAEPIENEMFDGNTHPVIQGSLGLTALLNKGKPTLAYLLGDRVEYTEAPCTCGRTLPRIHFLERDSEIFSLFGAKFTYRQIYDCIYHDKEVKSFLQIVLEDNSDGINMRLVLPQMDSVSSGMGPETLMAELNSQAGLSFLIDHDVLHFHFEFVSGEFFTKRKIRRVEDRRNKTPDLIYPR